MKSRLKNIIYNFKPYLNNRRNYSNEPHIFIPPPSGGFMLIILALMILDHSSSDNGK